MANGTPNSHEIQTAFAEYDREQTISNFKVACVIGMVLMPAGVIIDNAVYPGLAPGFLKLRLLSVIVIGAFLTLLLTPLGHKHYRFLGITLFMVPASFIAWFIYASPEGAASPYYAGLNLVVLVLAFVLHWTFRESLSAAVLVVGLYLAAALFHGGPVQPEDRGIFTNNIYFLVLTGIIVATGSYFHSKSRFGEFAFRYQLDKQNRVLETTIQQLKEAEMQLVQSEKLASLGRLSAGIIHEINNPLNFTATGLFTLRKKGKYLAPEHHGGVGSRRGSAALPEQRMEGQGADRAEAARASNRLGQQEHAHAGAAQPAGELARRAEDQDVCERATDH